MPKLLVYNAVQAIMLLVVNACLAIMSTFQPQHARFVLELLNVQLASQPTLSDVQDAWLVSTLLSIINALHALRSVRLVPMLVLALVLKPISDKL